ncbi:uncharacterized protein MICPUCDRAFT_16657 [Micromonas pusilla CCMP1545]|uniref:Predicted protein n=1 Tax=Micromonas pusilla (strain CCMP1545) TaxID=564608 RepID=C1MRF4_MICPC|nr:uncharacterized protein MICPUCDRAFT_16657 [Micromonas pusilla CCMP1545]EEH58249.1 predicted protein [Micromonas pusilla CCMP1545]|eukprot:XP_003058298.1 predicted protein [Micromonas pusilla CCMP1545]
MTNLGGPGFPGARGPGGFGVEKVFPVVRLRGLPFNASEYDVQEFFQGLEPVDVLIVRRDGRATGEAYVVLANQMLMEVALQKNRGPMGRRYIEVFRSKKQDYYHAVSIAVNEPDYGNGNGGQGGGYYDNGPLAEHTGVLKLRGLPFSATKDDIITFFDDKSLGVSPLVHDSIHIVLSVDGRPSGVAFVEFVSAEDAKTAMIKDRSSMGTRYVELFPSSREEATRAATSGR